MVRRIEKIMERSRSMIVQRRIQANRSASGLSFPPTSLGVLKDLIRRTRNSGTRGILGKTNSHSSSVVVLLSGPPGTGKTLAAEWIAKELRWRVHRVNLKQLAHKFIGETEKNLSKAFENAELQQAVLVFDEADALLGKRSPVKDSHDRYANQETNYLLSRMEQYRGLIILTTNQKALIDPTVIKKVTYLIEFSPPLPTPSL